MVLGSIMRCLHTGLGRDEDEASSLCSAFVRYIEAI